MPGTDWQGEHGNVLMYEASLNKVCVHTIVGNPPAHAAHFSTRGDGYVYQSRDTRFRSAANLYGNDDVVAIENDDHGPEFGSWNVDDGHQVPAFTAAQCEAIAKICVWAYHTHGIPLVLCPDSRDASEGISYHRQGIDGNYASEGYAYGGRVAGGERWSTSSGKVCPGDRRIKQLIEVIIPRARVLAGLEVDVSTENIERMMWKGGDVPGSVVEGTLIDDVREIQRMMWAGGAVEGSTDVDSLVGRVRLLEDLPGLVGDLAVSVHLLGTAVADAHVKLDQIIAKLNEGETPPA